MERDSSSKRKDKLWGLGVIAVSILSVGGGLGATGLGGAPGFVGQLASSVGIAGQTTPRATILGGAIALLSAIRIFSGFGIWKGQRWGFLLAAILAAILSALSLPLNLAHLAHGTAKTGLLINRAILYYCWLRLTSKS